MITRLSDIFTALVLILTCLAQAESEYHYQKPSGFQLPDQPYIRVQPPSNVQYTQGLTVQQTFDITGPQYQNQQNPQFHNNQHASHGPIFASTNYYQSYDHNGQSVASQNVQQTNLISANSVVAPPVQPLVMKHIYFHVPPPDLERSVAQVPKKKKTYNIVFIKVPSQRPRYSTPQGFTTNPYVPVEDKTVIYVLVKKPEDLQEARANAPPNHEVYYVKYKESGDGKARQINNQVSQVTSVPSLRPGLVNGLN